MDNNPKITNANLAMGTSASEDTTMPVIRIVFAQEGLHEAIKLLRIATGTSGRDPAEAGAKDNFFELNRLVPVAEERLGSRHLIEIESRAYSALGTSETRVRLEPSAILKERV